MTPSTEWKPLGPRSFVDRRMALRRMPQDEERTLVRYAVRAYHGAIIRRGEDGKPEYDRCPHAHSKAKNARLCAEKECRRRNRAIKKAAKEGTE